MARKLSRHYVACTCSFVIGTRSDLSAGSFFGGQIDNVSVYNYGLTGTQVKTLYNENSAVRFGPLTGSP